MHLSEMVMTHRDTPEPASNQPRLLPVLYTYSGENHLTPLIGRDRWVRESITEIHSQRSRAAGLKACPGCQIEHMCTRFSPLHTETAYRERLHLHVQHPLRNNGEPRNPAKKKDAHQSRNNGKAPPFCQTTRHETGGQGTYTISHFYAHIAHCRRPHQRYAEYTVDSYRGLQAGRCELPHFSAYR